MGPIIPYELYNEFCREAHVEKRYEIPSEWDDRCKYEMFLRTTNTIFHFVDFMENFKRECQHWKVNGTIPMFKLVAEHLDIVHFRNDVFGGSFGEAAFYLLPKETENRVRNRRN